MRFLLISVLLAFGGCADDQSVFPKKDLIVGNWIEKNNQSGVCVRFMTNDSAYVSKDGNKTVDSLIFQLDAQRGEIDFSEGGKSGVTSHHRIRYTKETGELFIYGINPYTDYPKASMLVRQ